MNSDQQIKTGEISLPFGAYLERICCPFCGKILLGEVLEKECPHLLLVYTDLVPEFQYIHPEIEAHYEAWMAEDPNDRGPEEYIEATESLDFLTIQVNTSGMACGPVSSSVVFRFQANPAYLAGLESPL